MEKDQTRLQPGGLSYFSSGLSVKLSEYQMGQRAGEKARILSSSGPGKEVTERPGRGNSKWKLELGQSRAPLGHK